MVEELNSSNFEKKTKGKKAIVDFWAPWCGPCRMMAPVFEELAKEFKGKLDFFKLNVDDNDSIAERFSVQGIPCLVMIKDGKEVDRIVGFQQKDSLKKLIERMIS